MCLCACSHTAPPTRACVPTLPIPDTHGCSANAICTNSFGGRWCHCKAGYEGNPYFGQCVDVDECSLGLHVHGCAEHTHCAALGLA